MLAMGAALADQRATVTATDDMPLIRHIAFSTIPETRRNLLRALLLSGDSLTSTNAATVLRLTKPTVLGWMKELAATGIVELTDGDSNTSQPASVTLGLDWKWLTEAHAVHRSAA
jgi:hypothetical protein